MEEKCSVCHQEFAETVCAQCEEETMCSDCYEQCEGCGDAVCRMCLDSGHGNDQLCRTCLEDHMHDYVDGECRLCGLVCTHVSGTKPTATSKWFVCDDCGERVTL